MILLTIEDVIKESCPALRIATLECEVSNSQYSAGLWEDIHRIGSEFQSQYQLTEINKRSPIAATRDAYKKLGKDPNRYRPSAEALCRRILRGIPLYQINTLVDLINLVSLRSGYSIGGFDANKIEGNLTLGVGRLSEEFHAIGRGLLNVDGLPIYRDQIGGIGTPTSDEERTKIGEDTSRLLMIINAYSGEDGLQEAIDLSINLIQQYAFNEKNTDFHINLY